ncbi:acyl-CoA thioester hydrolase [Stigmatella aurantiaca]|uniref:Acyl-CoA thioester hydrolase n=1 Tax=Stigmatella aurantiaca TaxID=41 RepID=A0A1H7WSL0_STIAU|nr:thioesterase family protein [Stigmatella aurantiaca]SEM24421.1 acyl-CoA thioester hydrolase [Stigmatella aurantiaca]
MAAMSETLKDFAIVTPRFPVHWSEMDAYGHVNNARFFVWFESARIAYLARIGLVSSGHSGVGPILATTSADYLKPVVYPASLVAGARVARVGRTSLSLEHAVADADTGTLYARGSSVIVTIRYPAYEKIPVPAEVRAAIEAVEGRAFPPAP